MNQYRIYDENKDLMRMVSRLEEARQIVTGRSGWSFKLFRLPKKMIDLNQFEGALF
jgi:hypothetical protein